MTPQALALQAASGASPALGSRAAAALGREAKARNQAQEFEAVLLSTMFQNMFTGIGEEGPLGNATGVGIWRSFLTEEYARSFTKAGGVGLADTVARELLARQEIATSTAPGASRR
jgi:Rod binding domain-containing protein